MVTNVNGRAPLLWHFHDARSGTFTHLVACPQTRRAALIDPVLGFEPRCARIDIHAAQQVASMIRTHALTLEWVLETHIHADHLSSAQFFKQNFGAKVGIGERACEVQRLYAPLFSPHPDLAGMRSRFDHLWNADERFTIGRLDAQALSTPGHTRDGVTYRIGDHAFVGDTVFRADFGTARTDLIGGDASELYRSISRLYALPARTSLHFCHDYPKSGGQPIEQMSVERMRSENVHVSLSTTQEEFVALRRSRDVALPVPDLLIPSIQVNMNGGHLPPADENGIAYLKVPLNVVGGTEWAAT